MNTVIVNKILKSFQLKTLTSFALNPGPPDNEDFPIKRHFLKTIDNWVFLRKMSSPRIRNNKATVNNIPKKISMNSSHYIVSETLMLRNHYFSGFFLRPKFDNLLLKLFIVGVVCETSLVSGFLIVLLNFHT